MTGPKLNHDPAILDQDDDGLPAAEFNLDATAQDEAFCAAMRRAIDRGKERAVEGIKKANPDDVRSFQRRTGTTFVATASSIDTP